MQQLKMISMLAFCLSISGACVPTTTGTTEPEETLEEEEQEEQDEEEEEPTLGEIGDFCNSNADCEMGDCLNIFSQYDIKGYCTQTCTADTDCEGYSDENATWACKNLGSSGSHCMMECNNENCPNDYVCLRNVNIGQPTDLCLSFGEACDDGVCPEGEYCTIGSTGYEFFSLCSDDPVGFIKGGETCDANIEYGMPCTVASDCPSGYNCPSDVEVADRTCQPDQENRCAAYICWNDGTCASPCEADGDCASGETCQGFNFNVNRSPDTTDDDGVALVKLCRPAKATGDSCTSNADCDGTEVCQMARDTSGNLVMGCQEPASGAPTFGEACGDDPRTLDTIEPSIACDTDVCMDATCSKYCTADTDCGDGYQCVSSLTSAMEGGAAKTCLKGASCNASGDCGADEICLPTRTGNGYVKRCITGFGEVAAGEACDATAGLKDNVSCMDDSACDGTWVCDRANHQCRPPLSETCEFSGGACFGTGYCSTSCATDSDCPGSDYHCQGVPSTYNNNNTGDVSDDMVGLMNYCVYLPGSRTACTKEADCTTEGESCLISRDASGVAQTVCSSSHASATGASGDACGATANGPVQCQTGFCDYLNGDTLGPDNTDDPMQGKCTHLCATDDDCDTGRSCEDYEYGPTNSDSVKICR
ncbi:MAG: hypothetical protein CMH56_08670 [Myxococcales bacterium]|nr:hypothetical protein [Myxococcales bacterium]